MNVSVVDDYLYEDDEMFCAYLQLPAGSTDHDGGVEFDPVRANVTILDNDSEC